MEMYVELAKMFREFLYVGTNMAMLTIFMEKMLTRKRPLTVWILCGIFKLILINLLYTTMLWEEIHIKGPLQTSYLMLSSTIAIGLYFAVFYTYEEEPIKCMIVSVISEMLDVVIGSGFSMFINALSKRMLFTDNPRVQIYDFLFPILLIITMPIICKILEPMFRKIRGWQVKRKTIWSVFMAAYIVAALASNFITYKQSMLWMYFLVVIVILILFFVYARLLHRRAVWEKEYLQKQQRLSKMQYSAIAMQVEKMEQAQREINEQMQKIMAISDDIVQKTEMVERFIQGLKRQSQVVMQGMFCDSWFVDSVLCHQMEKCRERDIKADFQLQQYQKGNIREADLAELTHYLLESILENDDNSWISLHMASIKGQLILEIKSNSKRVKISNRKVQKYMKGYPTVMNVKQLEHEVDIKVVCSLKRE